MQAERTKSKKVNPPRIDLEAIIGEKHGRLTILKFLRRDPRNSQIIVWCRCDCGVERENRYSQLRHGSVQSCGCLRLERITKHGHTRYRERPSKTYHSWTGMQNRCNNPNDKSYADYGGRGISICSRWDVAKGGSFVNFLADMGERPDGTSLDRIDNDGNYEPGNCQWATQREQSQNRRPRFDGVPGETRRNLRAHQFRDVVAFLRVVGACELGSDVDGLVAEYAAIPPKRHDRRPEVALPGA